MHWAAYSWQKKQQLPVPWQKKQHCPSLPLLSLFTPLPVPLYPFLFRVLPLYAFATHKCQCFRLRCGNQLSGDVAEVVRECRKD